MSRGENRITFHEDEVLFREALYYSESRTGFSAYLIEKDYYCSLLLQELESIPGNGLVFKGGTCLSKVHADFYRMSEDLDFIISTDRNSTRADRRTRITPVKERFLSIPDAVPCFSITQTLQGFNRSTQYKGTVSYQSMILDRDERISIEISLREEIQLPPERLPARTLLMDPLRVDTAVEPVFFPVLTLNEAYAEKWRAALTRREPAIRDFYDIDYSIRVLELDYSTGAFLDLLRKKLAVPGNDPIEMSGRKFDSLRRQIETQLKPMLRIHDFKEFDLDEVYHQVLNVAALLTDTDRMA